MPGDSGSSPNADSFSKLLLDPGDFHSNPSGLPSFNKSETVLWTIAKILRNIKTMTMTGKTRYMPPPYFLNIQEVA
jgi:hypothetical protein